MPSLYYFMLLSVSFALLLLVYIPFRKSESAIYKFFVAIISIFIFSLVTYDIVMSIFKTNDQDYAKKHKEYMSLAGDILGKQLRYSEYDDPRSKVLIIDFPADTRLPRAGVSKNIIAGLEKGLKMSGFSISAIERAETDKSNDYWLSASEFDRIIKKHPEAGLVISLVGLPKNLSGMTFWNEDSSPFLVLFGGNLKMVDQALKHKVVIAAITFLPGATFREKKDGEQKSQKQVFNEHFLYITEKNYEEIQEEFPLLFK